MCILHPEEEGNKGELVHLSAAPLQWEITLQEVKHLMKVLGAGKRGLASLKILSPLK